MRHLRRGSLVLLSLLVIPSSAFLDASPLVSSPAMLASARDARQVTLPAGTVLRVRVERGFGSDVSRREDPVNATLARSVTVRGTTVLPAGSHLSGYVAEAQRPGKVKGRGRVAVRFTRIRPAGDDEAYAMRTRSWVAVARATKGKDATTIAVPAAGGAIIGGLLNGKKGAGIGALLTIRLTAPLTVTVDR